MSWITLTLCSAMVLGVYDLLRKSAVKDNAVPPVLFLSVLTGSLVWLPFLVLSQTEPNLIPHPILQVDPLTWREHGLIFGKSAIVSFSWTFAYFAIKHLPLTVASPIRSTSPVWTILLAMVFSNESPTVSQWIGIVTILLGFYGFTLVGKLEGIHFHSDKWVLFMILAAIVAGGSSFYDRWLFQSTAISPSTVQCWFTIDLVLLFLPFVLIWKRGWVGSTRFQWRWSIPAVGLTLLVADLAYFTALTDPAALVSIVSPIRRTAVIVSFLGGAFVFRERHIRKKALYLGVLILGVLILEAASRESK